jgi:hypothetical protein
MSVSADALVLASRVARAVVEDVFPGDMGIFPDVWAALRPVFGAWEQAVRGGKRVEPTNFLDVGGLGFAEWGGRDFAICMMATVVTCLDLWYRDVDDRKTAGGTALEWARSFGADEDLQNILKEKITRSFYEMRAEVEARPNPDEGEPIGEPGVLPSKRISVVRWDKETRTGPLSELTRVISKARDGKFKRDLFIDDLDNVFLVRGKPVKLSVYERRLVLLLFQRVGWYWENEELFERIWKKDTKTTNDFKHLLTRTDRKLGGLLGRYVSRPKGMERCHFGSAIRAEMKYVVIFRVGAW